MPDSQRSPGFTGPEPYISDAHQAAHRSCALKRENSNVFIETNVLQIL